ncbi:hypothetical protein GUJ93_ZPchr0014g47416 [Zizania palustris]|uniref:Uncharacterized protein n=1 Tax=Zizania palustris TaxID=103762 RepID=A0A8J5TFU9_ZIZPA|nr:hypothetical protein GUJ93_ZPchr0014g47416 [Zizania palustris]
MADWRAPALVISQAEIEMALALARRLSRVDYSSGFSGFSTLQSGLLNPWALQELIRPRASGRDKDRGAQLRMARVRGRGVIICPVITTGTGVFFDIHGRLAFKGTSNLKPPRDHNL